MATDFTTLFLVFVSYAFIGWITEVLYAFYIEHKWINRGFLYGPFCPIYGVGAIAIISIVEVFNLYIMKSRPLSLIEMFFLVLLITSAIEWLTGYFLEKIFHAQWWDYSNNKFNIMGYICLKFSICWGAIGVFVIKVVNPLIMRGLSYLEGPMYTNIGIMLMLYFALDGYKTVRGMIDLRNLILELERFSVQFKNDIERISMPIRQDFERVRGDFEEKRQALSAEIKEKMSDFEDFNGDLKEKIEHEVRERFDFVEYNLRDAIEKKQVEAANIKAELAEKIYALRLYRAFPKMKSMKYPDLLRPVKEIQQRRRNSK
ncbi:putative ABC transporter permease [Fusibacter sp. 3D3]|uniref:putative ABC transporter permease n=1 Tax=Fusibacter sp. 3D3 TaxID=1048380 RepID=UPI000853E237|nr:putative ABC transporter permease [Fusibacter sp. 3D3]GAU79548.1 arginine/ornithine antiporter ArcD [Fusibacter sp. 3D3]